MAFPRYVVVALAASLVLFTLVAPVVEAKCSSNDKLLSDTECTSLCASNYGGTTCDAATFDCNNIFLKRECCLKKGSATKTSCIAKNLGTQDCYCSIAGIKGTGFGIIGGAGFLTVLLLLLICCCCCKMCRGKKGDTSHA
jgi:hypothetical protein